MNLKKSLKSLISTFVEFVKKDFNWKTYAYTLAFIFICIFLNYHFDFYKNIMRNSYYTGKSMWMYPLFYIFIYFSTAIPVLLIQKDYKTLKNYRFYLKSLFFIIIYGVSIGFYKYRQWELPDLSHLERNFVMRIIAQLKSVVLIVIPLIFLKLSIDKKNVKGFYGLSWNSKHLDAYMLLFLLLLPFLVITSFTPDFLKAYPQFRPWHYDGIFNLSTIGRTLIFESAYSVDFVVTELFFRGALIIGMTSILGPKAILPMVAFYASIHFGKPIVETISSIFGGYILGVLAYQTKHIWGGVIVHIGIALTMEVMGFIQYYLLK
ncbi:CPBP family intramembrane metalloprotease [Paludibacter sp. 221]|uniref:CPBP family intramembrane glutamic endopeptidase n=1 Tax=Paludibacter sp. 221 TaxID=2302939 RepID=UPI0013D3A8D8|nr:CPBP family intramembrane glutamic endopeptidase [Paludibacter sp. 221]NDV45865.1 CPBP family intramembrane metalloprotease [Paludibacter sp. 221]